MKKKMLIVPLLLMASGCSGSASPGDSALPPNESGSETAQPVTLKIYLNVGVNENEAQLYYIEPLKKKYPHITLDFVNMTPTKENHIDTLVAAGMLPDIVIASTTGIQRFQTLDFPADLHPLVQRHGLDLGKLDPVTLESLEHFSDKGELFALPVNMNFSALFYNKDLFDKFGEPYPKDGMTWDEAIELGKRLTRTEDGVRYRGLNPGGADLMGYGLSLPYVNPQTNKAELETEAWKKVVGKAAQIYSQPGWLDGELPSGQGGTDFLELKDTAMLASWSLLGALEKLHVEGQSLNWDMASIPNFPEAIGTARETDFHVMMISKTSPHQDEAFQAVAHFLSDEVQSIMNRNGRLTALKKTDDYRQSFGAELKSLQGKHIEAIFDTQQRPMHKPTPYDAEARKKLVKAAYEVGSGASDVNTALRKAQEETDKYIAGQLAGAK